MTVHIGRGVVFYFVSALTRFERRNMFDNKRKKDREEELASHGSIMDHVPGSRG
jgi:hypothetical protein